MSEVLSSSRATDLIERYRLMVQMRAFEAACAEGITTGELRGELHLADGQEAIAAGMVGTLRRGDWMTDTHRPHQNAIAKGVALLPMLAEIYEKATGLCRGKGGHLHLFDMVGRFSTTGIVGSSLPVAAGHAYAARLAGTNDIAVGICGDGATNAGQFHETLNMAAIWSLPLVVLVINNQYGISVPAREVIAGAGIAERGAAYGIWHQRVDGTDVEIVAEAFREAVDHTRSGAGPALLEATCYRFRGHYEGDYDHYRTRGQKREMIEKGDPLAITRARVLERRLASESQLAAIEAAVRDEMGAILAEVRGSPEPDPSQALTDVFGQEARA